jgi:hypothetical protein
MGKRVIAFCSSPLEEDSVVKTRVVQVTLGPNNHPANAEENSFN